MNLFGDYCAPHTHHIALRNTSPFDTWLNCSAPFPGRNIVKETGSMQDIFNMCCTSSNLSHDSDNNNKSNSPSNRSNELCQFNRSLSPNIHEVRIFSSETTTPNTIAISPDSVRSNNNNNNSEDNRPQELTMIFKTFKRGIKWGELSLYEAALAAKKMMRSPSTSMIINASMMQSGSSVITDSFVGEGNINDSLSTPGDINLNSAHLLDDSGIISDDIRPTMGNGALYDVCHCEGENNDMHSCPITAAEEYHGPSSLSGLLIPEIFVVEEQSANGNLILPVKVNCGTTHRNSDVGGNSTQQEQQPLTLSCMKLHSLRGGDVKVIGLLMNKGWRCLDSHLKHITPLHRTTAALYKSEALTQHATASISKRSTYGVDLVFHPVTNFRLLAGILFLVAKGLNQLHYLNFSHNDLRLPNIIIWKTNHIRICDFEFSRPVSQPSHDLEAHYRSPQGSVDDIWCFGLLVIEMLTGVSPFISPNIVDDFASDYLSLGDLGWEENLRAAVAERIAAYNWCVTHQRESSIPDEEAALKSSPDDKLIQLVTNYGPNTTRLSDKGTSVLNHTESSLQLLDNMLSLCLHNDQSKRLTPYEKDGRKQQDVLMNHPFFVEALLPHLSKEASSQNIQKHLLATIDSRLMKQLEAAAVEQLAAWR